VTVSGWLPTQMYRRWTSKSSFWLAVYLHHVFNYCERW